MFMLAPVKLPCPRGPAYPSSPPPKSWGSRSSQEFPSEHSPLLLQEEATGETSTGHLPSWQSGRRDRGLPGPTALHSAQAPMGTRVSGQLYSKVSENFPAHGFPCSQE